MSDFLALREDEYIRRLMLGYQSDRYHEFKMLQFEAWRNQYKWLNATFRSPILSRGQCETWALLGEFPIPRRMGRIDNVLLIRDAIVVLEFKADIIESAALTQVTDYALDLAYFHRPSRGRTIYPLVIGGNRHRNNAANSDFPDSVTGVRVTPPEGLADVLNEIAEHHSSNQQANGEDWDNGDYFPVPTIVEAAIGMFRDMQVDDIAHADADPKNLGKTIDAIRTVIIDAAHQRKKSIVFVTGVPGAGKTLAGLKLVHDRDIRDQTSSELAFLSGNGPLVAILRAALAAELRRRKRLSVVSAGRDPKTLIQSVYSYKNAEWLKTSAPAEHVLIFDEAQRAWDAKHTVRKLKYDPSNPKACDLSEPALILEILNRQKEWAVLICLVGGGQEIHTGEAGLAEWGRALSTKFSHWQVFASPNSLRGDKSGTRITLFPHGYPPSLRLVEQPELHLDNPTRQFRGKTIASWAESILQGDAHAAASTKQLEPAYPIAFTRSLPTAKHWLRQKARGSERYGLIASSNAKRLRAYGVFVPGPMEPAEHWFLAPRGDVRSSFQLEIAATEFQIQGLEVDFAAVCWGGDFLIGEDGNWELKEFKGTKWSSIKSDVRRAYALNTYRVLLTRARQGLLLFVPEGTESDPTTTGSGYNRTSSFLRSCGVTDLDS